MTPPKKTNLPIIIIVILCALAVLNPWSLRVIKEKKRTHDFYTYIMDNIDSIYGGEGSDSLQRERIKAFERGFLKDSMLVEMYLNNLECSSNAYKQDIKKSSSLILNFNDTVPFDEALRMIVEEGYGLYPNIRLYYVIELKRKYGAQARKNIQKGELLIQDELDESWSSRTQVNGK